MVASGNGAKGLIVGMRVLRRGGSALDAVEAATRVVEDDERDHSVGAGGLPNVLGEVELDASIMDGRTRRAGGVGALRGYRNPITIARAVMERLPHVLLAGDGAARFAREIGAETAELLTDEARELWRKRLRRARVTPETVAKRKRLARIVWSTTVVERGTVNFIAVDREGNLASAVSTSGWAYKYPGRVGDSPIVGAGNYCDSRYGAATCSGFGELAMRALTARITVEHLRDGASAEEAARAAIAETNALEARYGRTRAGGGSEAHADARVSQGYRRYPSARINVVVLAPDGTYASATTRRGARYAVLTAKMARPLLLPRTLVLGRR